MYAKSLGALLLLIYAVDELQNPFPVKQCCLKVMRIAFEGEMVSFPNSSGLRLLIQHCIKVDEGSHLLLMQREKDGGRKLLPHYGCSKDF